MVSVRVHSVCLPQPGTQPVPQPGSATAQCWGHRGQAMGLLHCPCLWNSNPHGTPHRAAELGKLQQPPGRGWGVGRPFPWGNAYDYAGVSCRRSFQRLLELNFKLERRLSSSSYTAPAESLHFQHPRGSSQPSDTQPQRMGHLWHLHSHTYNLPHHIQIIKNKCIYFKN